MKLFSMVRMKIMIILLKNIKLASDGSSFDLYEKDKFISNFFCSSYMDTTW